MKQRWDGERDPLAALRRGDPSLFEDFVRREASTLLGFFQRLGAPEVEAEDLTQEVFLKLFRSAATYAPLNAFSAFTWRVARHAWIDRRRRGAAHAEAAAGCDPAEIARSHDPSRGAVEREEGERIRGGLAQLSQAHRLAFELAVVQELSCAEIAEVLEIPVGTVKSRVFHAVRRLRGVLAGEPGALEVEA